MQAGERYRLMEAYRHETAGRLGLGVKCAVCVSVITVLALAASGTGNGGAAKISPPTHAVVRANDGDPFNQKPTVDEHELVSPSPVISP